MQWVLPYIKLWYSRRNYWTMTSISICNWLWWIGGQDCYSWYNIVFSSFFALILVDFSWCWASCCKQLHKGIGNIGSSRNVVSESQTPLLCFYLIYYLLLIKKKKKMSLGFKHHLKTSRKSWQKPAYQMQWNFELINMWMCQRWVFLTTQPFSLKPHTALWKHP